MQSVMSYKFLMLTLSLELRAYFDLIFEKIDVPFDKSQS